MHNDDVFWSVWLVSVMVYVVWVEYTHRTRPK